MAHPEMHLSEEDRIQLVKELLRVTQGFNTRFVAIALLDVISTNMALAIEVTNVSRERRALLAAVMRCSTEVAN